MVLFKMISAIETHLASHMQNNPIQAYVNTADNSFHIYLIIHSILDCTTPQSAAASKQTHCSVSVLLANMVYGQTCGPSLAQTDMEACFHALEPTIQSFGYCLMFVLEALAALC